ASTSRVDQERLIRYCPINITTNQIQKRSPQYPNIEQRNLLYQLSQEVGQSHIILNTFGIWT
ncbi:MAG: hypothetical protein ACOVOV_03490, partial [Dolichospermum sp.]